MELLDGQGNGRDGELIIRRVFCTIIIYIAQLPIYQGPTETYYSTHNWYLPTYLPFRPARAYINKQMYMRYCSQQLVVAVIQFLNVLGCSARGALKVGSFQLSNPTGRHLCFLPFMLLTPLPPQCMRFVPNDFLFYSPVILLSSL